MYGHVQTHCVYSGTKATYVYLAVARLLVVAVDYTSGEGIVHIWGDITKPNFANDLTC